MRRGFLAVFTSFFLIFQVPLGAQETQSPSSNTVSAVTLLAQSLKALAGSGVINDVTLTGTARRIEGSNDETGTAILKELLTSSRLDLGFGSGTRSEIRTAAGSVPVGTWIGPDGISHSISKHNLFTDPGWFPLFALSNVQSSSNSVVTNVGQETRNGTAVIHVSASKQFAGSSDPNASLLQHLTQVEIYLDASTLLPLSFVFNLHPDNDMLIDSPVEIRYLEYRNAGGVQVPVHIQKFINNSLTLDLVFQDVSANTGLTVAQITGQ